MSNVGKKSVVRDELHQALGCAARVERQQRGVFDREHGRRGHQAVDQRNRCRLASMVLNPFEAGPRRLEQGVSEEVFSNAPVQLSSRRGQVHAIPFGRERVSSLIGQESHRRSPETGTPVHCRALRRPVPIHPHFSGIFRWPGIAGCSPPFLTETQLPLSTTGR